MGFGAGVLGAIVTTLAQHAIGRQAGIVDYDGWIELGLRFGLGRWWGTA